MSDTYLSPSTSPSPSPHKERGEIETTVPYETVKEAVTLFGERADLKNRIDWIEKRSPNGHGHHSYVCEELRSLKEQLDLVEGEKENLLHELSETQNRLAEVTIRLSEALASKDVSVKALEETNSKFEEAEDAKVKESEEKYLLWQAELEELKKKHCIVLSDLESAKEEIEKLRSELQNLNHAKLVAEKMFEEAKHSEAEALQKVEELVNDLSESGKTTAAENQARLAAEHARLTLEAAREADLKSAAKAAEQAQKEIDSLKKELASSQELEIQVLDISARLEHSKKELAKLKQTNCSLAAEVEEANARVDEAVRELDKTRMAEAAAASKSELMLKELEELKRIPQRSAAENAALMGTVESLMTELQSYKSEVASLRETEATLVSEAAESSSELNNVKEQLVGALAAEQSAQESIANLTQSLQRTSLEADETKSHLERAHEDLKKYKLETEQSKAMAETLESRLQAAYKETEAARAAEELASAEVKALKAKADAPNSNEDACLTITVSKEEYEALKIRLQEADIVANQKVEAGRADLDAAKAKEQELSMKLEEAYAEIESSKHAEKQALRRAENAEAAKIAVEGDLRKWRAENEQRRKATDSAAARSPLHIISALPSSESQERGQRVESLGQVLHIKFPPPADRIYPMEKHPTLKKRQKLLARIRSYLAKKRNSLKSFKDQDKGIVHTTANE